MSSRSGLLPFPAAARQEMGALLRQLQQGEVIGMPHSRPMPSIGRGCHELRVRDADHLWRLVYWLGPDEILVLELFDKKTRATPRHVIDTCKKRLADYRETKATAEEES